MVTCDGALLSWRLLNTCQPMGIGEEIPFALLACMALPSPVKLSLSQHIGFLTFALLILCLTSLGRSE